MPQTRQTRVINRTMVCKKSEYRKQFRKPSWETHAEHYQEKVDYRSYRRLLEHRHTFLPWDWDSGSSSEGSCNVRPQTAPNVNNNGGGASKHRKDVQPKQPIPQETDKKRPAVHERLAPSTGLVEKRPAGQKHGRGTQKGAQSKPARPARPSTSPNKTRKLQAEKTNPPPGETSQKPPILAYGWADSNRAIGAKMTYNVKSSSHPAYVHPDAIRAMKRREMIAEERQKEEDRINNRGKLSSRAVFTVIPPRDNVWMTEYQSSYCAEQQAKGGGR